MQLSGMTNGIYRISEWIMRFAYLNILWLVFTLMGAIVFGIMPATTSVFVVVRKWIRGEPEIPIFQNFWGNYRKSFAKTNLIGVVLFVIGFIIYIDFVYLTASHGFHSIALLLAFIVTCFFYLLLLMYIFPIFVHYDLKIPQYFKYALLFGLTNVTGTIIMVGVLFAMCFIVWAFPAILPFFSVSLVAIVFMWAANLGFVKVLKSAENDSNLNK
ncbi:YesL family protein [Neobacillus dielmonensis]|uniref:YesL family protein n=1 Tax=Neobacillus dielmonensis TaxID=1347369 RepID=UPI0005AA2151|nr:YesL family protein [Neobacillus dielmonensis]